MFYEIMYLKINCIIMIVDNQSYSIINGYDYANQSCVHKFATIATLPVRIALGGKSISLETGKVMPFSIHARILSGVSLIIILPTIIACSGYISSAIAISTITTVVTAFAIKYFSNESKLVLEKYLKQDDQKPQPLNDVKVETPKLDIIISDETKKKIVKGTLSQKELKEEYSTLTHGRRLPGLLGYNQYAPHAFAMLMSGIALISSLLCKKYKLSNLWVCQSNEAFQDKLKEIKNSPINQRHALIVQTHSSMNSAGHSKKENWEQHKMTVCVE